MKIITSSLALAALAASAGASNMSFKLERTFWAMPEAHLAAGVNFSNGWALTIVASVGENPDLLVADLFADTGCTGKRLTKSASPDSCALRGNPALGCTRFVTPCALVGYAKSNMGFKLERAVSFLAARSSTKAMEVWDGAWTVDARRQVYLSVPFLDEDAEAHATVSTSTTADLGVLDLLEVAYSRFIDIPIYTRAAHMVSAKTCSVLLETGTCSGKIHSADAAAAAGVFDFPPLVLSFP